MEQHTTSRAPATQGIAILAIAACALLWSTGGLFVKLITWNPFAIAGARSLIGGIVLLLFLRRPRFTWSFAQIAGAVCYAACMIGFVSANKLTTAANAIMLQYTSPIYAAVFGWIFLRERTGALDWVTICVVLAGMGLFFMDKLTVGGMVGNVLAIGSGVFFAGSIVAFRAQKEGSSLESILLSHVITFVVSLPFLWREGPRFAGTVASGAPLSPSVSTLAAVGCIVLFGVFQIGISSILLSYGVKRVTAVQSILVAVLEPLFNPVWVFLVVGERPGPRALVGGAIILVAVTLRSLISLRSAVRQAAAG